jgi:hypothetical protein
MSTKGRRILAAVLAAAAIVATAAGCTRKQRLDRLNAFFPGPATPPGAGLASLVASAPRRPGTEPKDAAAASEPRARAEEMEAARKLIRNAEISVEVARFEEASRRAEEIARRFGGYVADSQSSGGGERRIGTVVLRVRSDAFEPALAGLRALGKARSEHVSVQDVTRAYADLETRLRVKRDAADRVRELLRNRTAKLSDVLAAEKELSSLVEQIETMEGERRWYDRQVALSTISAEIFEPVAVARPSALEPLRDALRDSLAILSRSAAAFLVATLYVLPWGILVGTLLALRRRARRGGPERLAPALAERGASRQGKGTGEKPPSV